MLLMKHFSFARMSALGIAATLSAAGFSQAALLSFPNAAGGTVSYMPLPECKLSISHNTRSYTSGRFSLDIDDVSKPDNSNIHISMFPGSSQFDNLIDSMLHSVMDPQTMQITMLDDPFTKACTRYTFTDCIITSFTSPPCNREASTPSVSEIVVTKAQDAPTVDFTKYPKKSQLGAKQKAWLCSNFRVSIPGCDEACAHALYVKPITVAQSSSDVDGDGLLDFTISDFEMDVPADAAMGKGMYDWIRARDARPCTLDYLAADGTVLRRLTFSSLSPMEISHRTTSTITIRCAVSGAMSWTSS